MKHNFILFLLILSSQTFAQEFYTKIISPSGQLTSGGTELYKHQDEIIFFNRGFCPLNEDSLYECASLVHQVDSISLIPGYLRKRIILNHLNPTNQAKYGDLVWIEGIGSPNGLLYYKDWQEDTKTALTCYYDRGEKRYGDVQDCNTLVVQTSPFLTTHKEWVVYYEGFTSHIDNGIRTYWFDETKDTIDGIPLYELIYNTSINSNPIKTQSYFKEKNGKVSKYYDDGSEELIYNFNVKIGDTLVRFPSRPLFNLIVTKIDTVVFEDAKPRKRIHLLCEGENNNFYYWIEGMGGIDAFLYSDICTIFDSPVLDLRCFYENGVKVYQDSLVQDCLISKVKDTENIELIKIYPNPASDLLHIDIKLEVDAKYTYDIMDTQGRIVKSGNLRGLGHSTLDINTLPKGMYFINILNDEYSVAVQKFVKQ